MAEQEHASDGTYPFVGFHFQVEFHDSVNNDAVKISKAGFQEASGLSAQIGTEEVKEGGENTYAHRLPNPTKFGNLVLKRGLMEDDDLIKWIRDAVESFEFKPKDIYVKLLNEEHEPLQTWNFHYAYPVKWSVSGFNSTQNAVVVESVELAYKYFKVKS